MKPELVKRTGLLQVLDSVAPGLSPGGDVLQQSASFVFKGGWVAAFNNEVYCSSRSPLPDDLTAVVPGKPLIDVLNHLPDEDVELFWNEAGDRFVVAGASDEIELVAQAKIVLPLDKVERPGEVRDVGPEFAEALALAAEACGRDDQKFLPSCVHLTADLVESTDNFQVVRHKAKTGLESETLIRSSSAKAVAQRGPVEVSDTPGWLHYFNANGLRISVRRHHDDYFDLAPECRHRGKPISFPKSLIKGIDLANTFSAEYTSDNKVTVELTVAKRDNVKLVGEGVTGRATRYETCPYDGPPIAFTIGPSILSKIVERHSEIEVVPATPDRDARLVAVVGKLYYLAVTNPPGNHKKKAKENGDGKS